MNDNEEPLQRTLRDEAREIDLRRRMKVILPLLSQFLGRLNAAIEISAATNEPMKAEALAVEYRLWRNAADQAIALHWNHYEQSLSLAEREEQLPHAAEDFAEEILRPSEFEEIGEFLKGLNPPKSVRAAEEFYQAVEKIRILAPSVDVGNTTSFAQRSIKQSDLLTR